MAQSDIFLQGIAAQIQIAVSQSQILQSLNLILDFERRGLAWIQYIQTIDLNFDLAGNHIGINHIIRAFVNRARGRNHEFIT